MSSSQRLEGLELLRLVGAPTPEWQTARSRRDVDRLQLPTVEFGWTIRTCREDGKRETGLFYVNNAAREKVRRILRQRLGKASQHEFYIVYPSWRFQFSCNIVFKEQTYIVEGKYGSQKNLSAGKARPDFALRIPFGMRSQMTCYLGNPTDQVLAWLGRILSWCKRIPTDSFYAEVALTDVPALMFYELFAL
jgi:hypothetical protein